MKKEKLAISIVIFFISVVLFSLTFIQFRTVEKTNSMGIEEMREDELRQELADWKNKYNEIEEKIKINNEKIAEYGDITSNNKQSTELLVEELKEYNMLVGKTVVTGEGVIVKLTDNYVNSYDSRDLVELVNELKSASAEAVSINGKRIINMSDIVTIGDKYILVNGERISSPYEVKAIGDKAKMLEMLNFKGEGFYDKYKSKGYSIELSEQSNVRIEAYNQDITLKYIKGEE